MEKKSNAKDKYPVKMMRSTGNIVLWKSRDTSNSTVEKSNSFHWNCNANPSVIFFEDFGVTIKRAFLPKMPMVAERSDVVSIEPYNITTEKV